HPSPPAGRRGARYFARSASASAPRAGPPSASASVPAGAASVCGRSRRAPPAGSTRPPKRRARRRPRSFAVVFVVERHAVGLVFALIHLTEPGIRVQIDGAMLAAGTRAATPARRPIPLEVAVAVVVAGVVRPVVGGGWRPAGFPSGQLPLELFVAPLEPLEPLRDRLALLRRFGVGELLFGLALFGFDLIGESAQMGRRERHD